MYRNSWCAGASTGPSGTYRPLADAWILFDNSGAEPEVIASETDGASPIIKAEPYKSLTSLYGTT